jgi:NADPH:quinone reductase-like Zn-dependent oxidoreductase
MRAIQIDRFGGPEVLQVHEIAAPDVRDGDVLVRAVATSINPIDRKLRTIDRQLGFPLTLGWDLAGVVVESTVAEFGRGDRVIAWSHVLNTRNGTWADLVAVPAEDLAPAPAGATLVEAATLPLAGLTALQAWRSLSIGPDSRLLVIGAAGAIGAHAVRMAVDAGIAVDGVVSRIEHFEEVKGLGAVSVSTKQDDLWDHSYDAVFDTVGLPASGVDAGRLLKPSGEYVTSASAGGLPTEVSARKVLVRRDAEGLRELSRLVDAGVLRLRVAASYPLREIQAAQAHFEAGGLLGKVVVLF